jgi:acetyl esterase/lipase
VTRLTDITDPLLVVYRADEQKNNRGAVIICPGGGYSILAIDKEGYEIAGWLNRLGYTAFVLQYRVPKKQHGALQDIQRAIRVVRSRSSEWDIDPNKLGVLGFSAGGSLCARASTRYDDITYEAVDDADHNSARPDFAVLIYPAYLDRGHNRTLTPELRVDRNTPPMFLFATHDDRHGNSTLVMAHALSDKNVPVEVHLLPIGGHGYGLRPGNRAAETWPKLLEAWMEELLGSM